MNKAKEILEKLSNICEQNELDKQKKRLNGDQRKALDHLISATPDVWDDSNMRKALAAAIKSLDLRKIGIENPFDLEELADSAEELLRVKEVSSDSTLKGRLKTIIIRSSEFEQN